VLQSFHIVFPDGDSQEIENRLKPNQLVDLNGNPLGLPLPTVRMIVYRVWKISTRTERKCEQTMYHLELVKRPELDALTRRGNP
jgi:hypothetical protein